MSNGLYFTLGVVVGVALTTVLFMARRRQAPPPAPLLTEVSEETLARARELVARGKKIHAIKAVREETGWDLARAKAVVDTMARGGRKKDDGFGYYGGF